MEIRKNVVGIPRNGLGKSEKMRSETFENVVGNPQKCTRKTEKIWVENCKNVVRKPQNAPRKSEKYQTQEFKSAVPGFQKRRGYGRGVGVYRGYCYNSLIYKGLKNVPR